MDSWSNAGLVLVLSAAVIACNSEPELPCATEGPVVDPSGDHWVYVVNSVRFPTNASEATNMGMNLDCDELGRVDNALGQILAAASSIRGSVLTLLPNGLIEDGAILHLIDVQTTSRDNATGVGVTIYRGVDLDGDATDNFSGSEPFDVDLSDGYGLITGHVDGGLIRGQLGSTPIDVIVSTSQAVTSFKLAGAKMEARFTADGIEGKIAGAIPGEDIGGKLLPFIAQTAAEAIERDCPDGTCAPGSEGATWIGLFDTDPTDGMVTPEEIGESNLVKSLFTPDLDLLDESGRYNPLSDGNKDSLSIGFEFTAVPAVHESP